MTTCRNHPAEPAATWATFDSPVGAFTVWLCEACLDAAEATGTLPGRKLSWPEAVELVIASEGTPAEVEP